MKWTHRKPKDPGLYWYRDISMTAPENLETHKILWDEEKRCWMAQTHGHGAHSVDSCTGEWCGPIAPPAISTEEGSESAHGKNMRIAVRLRHGGSFYFEKTIPDATAKEISEKLKALRTKGSSIPIHLRARIHAVLRELIRFADDSPDRGRRVPVGNS